MFKVCLLIHIFAGTVCLISGIGAMSSKKKRGMHSLWGEIYHSAFVVVFVTSLIMAIMNWENSAYLFFIGVFSYSFAFIGYLSAKNKWKNWLALHISGMLGSYIAICTAILVVNISNIPIVNEWHPLFFWFLPSIIGSPLIFMVGRRYKHFKTM
ncbi:DUF2306 domain-containing protein [Lederbergia lenta]|uniref:DUF2306 domain-containing protein n=1 Tax=Lederbergia lenta TaxID=1467 RepID=UPI0009EDE475|nr:DUF2306 domain-containing protein [Lederbergia lenta]MEC2324364.1 DUF2306 domain-containing protein [Lederbergia lenta]